jgi:hypothetical protein
VRVDEHVVAGDVGVERGDVADPTHIGGQLVHLVYPRASRGTCLRVPQIGDHEIVRIGRLELR